MTTHRSAGTPAQEADAILGDLGVARADRVGGSLVVRSPITGEPIAAVRPADAATAAAAIGRAHQAFVDWRRVPAPRRGELVRLLGEDLRRHKQDLGRLVTIETGKILSEGL